MPRNQYLKPAKLKSVYFRQATVSCIFEHSKAMTGSGTLRLSLMVIIFMIAVSKPAGAAKYKKCTPQLTISIFPAQRVEGNAKYRVVGRNIRC